MEIWNVIYLVNKNFCLVITDENFDTLAKKDFFTEKIAEVLHKILFRKLAFVFVVN